MTDGQRLRVGGHRHRIDLVIRLEPRAERELFERPARKSDFDPREDGR